MTNKKPRGSPDGLKEYQAQVRESARLAIIRAIEQLKIDKRLAVWTNLQVCREAGLSSSVALSKLWNRDLREQIENHNLQILRQCPSNIFRPVPDLNREKITQRTSSTIKKLREELTRRDAELLSLEKEIQILREQLSKKDTLHRLIRHRF